MEKIEKGQVWEAKRKRRGRDRETVNVVEVRDGWVRVQDPMKAHAVNWEQHAVESFLGQYRIKG